MFRGSTVALTTPFKNGKVDVECLKKLVDFHVENGTNGLLPCGTTGESPTLSHEEHDQVIEVCIEASNGRLPVMAGTGSNSTAEAIRLTKHAAKAGADAALIVTPYYNKPSQEGVYQHFKAIADEVDIPIFLYNIAGRCVINIETETVARLARDCKNIVGVKEASGNLGQMQDVKLACPDDFILLSGDDALTVPLLSIGGVGVVSVLANILPKQVSEVVELYLSRKTDEARELHLKLLPLVKAMFMETNPVPVKKSMEILGMSSADVRLPITGLSDEKTKKLKEILKGCEFLSLT